MVNEMVKTSFEAEKTGKMNLTMKELLVLILVNRDWNGNTWQTDSDGQLSASFYHDDVDMKKMRGVLSSLVKKGIIGASEDYVNRHKYTLVSVNNKYTTGVDDDGIGNINWNMFDCKDEIVANMGYENFIEWASTLPESIVRGMAESKMAETFDVEFNEWADQEMMTHGKDISFKDWAEDEGMKHGNTEITEWAQHEDESHDARYGAEEVGCPKCGDEEDYFLNECCDTPNCINCGNECYVRVNNVGRPINEDHVVNCTEHQCCTEFMGGSRLYGAEEIPEYEKYKGYDLILEQPNDFFWGDKWVLSSWGQGSDKYGNLYEMKDGTLAPPYYRFIESYETKEEAKKANPTAKVFGAETWGAENVVVTDIYSMKKWKLVGKKSDGTPLWSKATQTGKVAKNARKYTFGDYGVGWYDRVVKGERQHRHKTQPKRTEKELMGEIYENYTCWEYCPECLYEDGEASPQRVREKLATSKRKIKIAEKELGRKVSYGEAIDWARANGLEKWRAETFEARERKIGSIRIVKNPNFPSGTSLQAYIKTNRAELRKVFGNPNMGESGDGKSKGKEWNLWVGGKRVTIYDKREKDKKGTKYFNIGGKGKFGALLVAQALSIHRNERVRAKETVPKWLEDKRHHQQVKSIDEHPDLTYERAMEYHNNKGRYGAETFEAEGNTQWDKTLAMINQYEMNHVEGADYSYVPEGKNKSELPPFLNKELVDKKLPQDQENIALIMDWCGDGVRSNGTHEGMLAVGPNISEETVVKQLQDWGLDTSNINWKNFGYFSTSGTSTNPDYPDELKIYQFPIPNTSLHQWSNAYVRDTEYDDDGTAYTTFGQDCIKCPKQRRGSISGDVSWDMDAETFGAEYFETHIDTDGLFPKLMKKGDYGVLEGIWDNDWRDNYNEGDFFEITCVWNDDYSKATIQSSLKPLPKDNLCATLYFQDLTGSGLHTWGTFNEAFHDIPGIKEMWADLMGKDVKDYDYDDYDWNTDRKLHQYEFDLVNDFEEKYEKFSRAFYKMDASFKDAMAKVGFKSAYMAYPFMQSIHYFNWQFDIFEPVKCTDHKWSNAYVRDTEYDEDGSGSITFGQDCTICGVQRRGSAYSEVSWDMNAETSGQWEIGEQLEEAQMNAEDEKEKCPSCQEVKWIQEDGACDDCRYCEYCEEHHPDEVWDICNAHHYDKYAYAAESFATEGKFFVCDACEETLPLKLRNRSLKVAQEFGMGIGDICRPCVKRIKSYEEEVKKLNPPKTWTDYYNAPTKGIDTFTEPFEESSLDSGGIKKWLAVGILGGLAYLGYRKWK